MNQNASETSNKSAKINLIIALAVLFLVGKLVLLGLKDPIMWTSVVVSSVQILIVAMATAYCLQKK